jgi:hypothetical protein
MRVNALSLQLFAFADSILKFVAHVAQFSGFLAKCQVFIRLSLTFLYFKF